MITITRSSFRLGVTPGRAPVIHLGWWWVCIGSWEARMADCAERDVTLRRGARQLRRMEARRRGWRVRG